MSGAEGESGIDDARQLEEIQPQRVLEGGTMDCGSGLVLLLRQDMQQIGPGEVLELRSREPTVKDDLPPWCRMVGHTYLGTLESDEGQRHFLRRALDDSAERAELERDKQRAREYEWRLRARSRGDAATRAYCRNFSFDVGQPASFDEKDRHPSAVEYLLASLAGDLSSGFATLCSRRGIELDDLEMTVKARLENVLAHVGLEEGDPSISSIEVTCFATSFDDEANVRQAWDETLNRSPVYSTLSRAATIRVRLSIT